MKKMFLVLFSLLLVFCSVSADVLDEPLDVETEVSDIPSEVSETDISDVSCVSYFEQIISLLYCLIFVSFMILMRC